MEVGKINRLELFFQMSLLQIMVESVDPVTGVRTVELQQIFHHLTMNTTTDLRLGTPIDECDDKNGETPVEEAFDTAQAIISAWLALNTFYWLITPKKLIEACNLAHSHFEKFVADAVQRRKTRSPHGVPGNSVFLDALLEETQDPEIIRDQILNVMFTARDTTSTMLS